MNYAFIDSQNLNLGIKKLGWKLDYRRFRIYLQERYHVAKAYLFIGFLPDNQRLYRVLESAGYNLSFKPIIFNAHHKPKGNVDADLVLSAMIEYNNYDQALIVSNDGDFYCLVKYFHDNDKLAGVISPDRDSCSFLLRKAAKERIVFMDNLRSKLEFIP